MKIKRAVSLLLVFVLLFGLCMPTYATETSPPDGTTSSGTNDTAATPEPSDPQDTEPQSSTPEEPEQQGNTPDSVTPEGSTPVQPEPDSDDPDGKEPESSTPVQPEPDSDDPEGKEPESSTPVQPEPDGDEPDGEEPEDSTPAQPDSKDGAPAAEDPQETDPAVSASTRMEAETAANWNLYEERSTALEGASNGLVISSPQVETVYQLELIDDLATANLANSPYVKFNVSAAEDGTYEFVIGAQLLNWNIPMAYIPVVANGKVYQAACEAFTGEDGLYEFKVAIELNAGENEIYCVAFDADTYLALIQYNVEAVSDAQVNFDYLDLPEGVTALAPDAQEEPEQDPDESLDDPANDTPTNLPEGGVADLADSTVLGALNNLDSMYMPVMRRGSLQYLGWHFVDYDNDKYIDEDAFMNMLYCLQSDRTFPTGQGYKGDQGLGINGTAGTYGENVWYSLSYEQRYAIGLIIMYGCPGGLWDSTWGLNARGDLNLKNPNIGYRFATQVLVWEICDGNRSPTYPYDLISVSDWYTGALGQNVGDDGTDYFVQGYEIILESLRNHSTIPSFMASTAASAPTHTLSSHGVSLTDSNEVLSKFNFSNTSNLTFTKSGNTLKATAKDYFDKTLITATKSVPNPAAAVYEIWYFENSDWQVSLRITTTAKQNVTAYMNLEEEEPTGSLKGTKTSSDGGGISGVTIQVKSGNTVIAETKTDANGNYSISNIMAGTYTVHEVIGSDSLYYCEANDKSVTITGGGTATVNFKNIRKTGSISGQKTSSDGGYISGITMQLKSGSTVVATTTTDANGKFSFTNIPTGTYTVHEVIDSGALYYCESNDKSITVTYNNTASVSFKNIRKTGSISGQKSSSDGGGISGITMQLKSGSTVVATTTTDANGKFSFTNIPTGTYTVHEVIDSGALYYCESNDKSVTVTFNGTSSVSFKNIRKTGNISGQKTSNDGGFISGITMQLKSGSTVIATTTTDASGKFSFTNIPTGTYTVHEVIDSSALYYCESNDQSVTVTFNGTSSVGFKNIRKTGNITGKKTSSTGTDLGGWTMQLKSGSTVIATTTTAADGSFSFTNIPTGTYTVHEVVPSNANYYCTSNDPSVTVTFNNTVAVSNIHNQLKSFKFTIRKSIDATADCINQIKDNPMYSLAGAKYQVVVNGTVTETLTTDANGYATSAQAYLIGTDVYVKEVSAPAGFKLNNTTYKFTITNADNGGSNSFGVSDEPVFDPPFAITKVDKQTTNPQGNTSFSGAIFKWEYYANTNWSGTPTRTWYFKTDANGWARYDPTYLASGYQSDALYFDSNGIYNIPLGTIKITEIVNSLGYIVIDKPLYCTIAQDSTAADGVKTTWSADSWTIMLDMLSGNFGVYEPIDTSLFGSLVIDKEDVDLGSTAQGAATLKNAKFQVINTSSNSVKIGNFAEAQPGEVCYEFYTDENGHFDSGAIFPLGSYVVKEVSPSNGYLLNTTWSQSFTVTSNALVHKFTADNNKACPETPIRGGIRIIKKDSALLDNTSAKELLAGITFSVISENNNPVVVGGKTYTKGQTVLTLEPVWDGSRWTVTSAANALPYGTYTVKENPSAQYSDRANTYYKLNTTPQTVKIETNQAIIDLTFINELIPGKVQVEKVNPAGQHLAGAKLLLEWSEDGVTWNPVVYNSNNTILRGYCSNQNLVDGTLTTDSNGIITFENLHPGVKYRLTELEAPAGYLLLSDNVYLEELPVENFTEEVTVVNTTGYSLPSTGVNDNWYNLTALGTVIMVLSAMASAAYIIFSKKRVI